MMAASALMIAVYTIAVFFFVLILAYPLAYFLVFRAGALRFTFLLMVIVPAWISLLLRVFAWKLIAIPSFLIALEYVHLTFSLQCQPQPESHFLSPWRWIVHDR